MDEKYSKRRLQIREEGLVNRLGVIVHVLHMHFNFGA